MSLMKRGKIKPGREAFKEYAIGSDLYFIVIPYDAKDYAIEEAKVWLNRNYDVSLMKMTKKEFIKYTKMFEKEQVVDEL